MKLPFKLTMPSFKLAMPKFGWRAKPSGDEDDEEAFGRASADDDEEAQLAASQTIILDDPDDEDEAPDVAARDRESGEATALDDDSEASEAGVEDEENGVRLDDDDADVPAFLDDFDDDDDAHKASVGTTLRALAVPIAAGAAGLILLGGGAWWWLAGGDHAAAPSAVAASGTPSVSMALPPAPSSLNNLNNLNNLANEGDATSRQTTLAASQVASAGALSPPMAAMATDGAVHGAEVTAQEHGPAPHEPTSPAPVGDMMQTENPGAAEHGISSATPPSPGAAAPKSLNAVADASQDLGAGIIVASVSPQAFAGLPPLPAATPLSPVPDPGLIEEGANGRLPRIDGDGRRPSQVYARPFVPPEGHKSSPRIAILVAGLGLSSAPTEAAIRSLPGAVSLVFDPYGVDLDKWVPQVREAGHEFLVSLPMESTDFPVTDPGPMGLLTTLEPVELRLRIDRLFGRMAGYVGIVGRHGTRYMTDEKDVTPILTALKWRGLIFVDASGSKDSLGPVYAGKINLPMASVRVVLDAEPTARHIDAQLAELEKEALAGKSAVGLGHPYPRTLERLLAWAATLEERGFVLAPVSAVVKGKAE